MHKIIKAFFALLFIFASFSYYNYSQAQTVTASILPLGKTQFLDANGKPLSSGKVYFYQPGTTTLKTTWKDSQGSVANANPVILDAGGWGVIYGEGSYRQIVRDRNNVLIWDQLTSSTGSGGSTPTAVGDGNLVGTVLPWAGLTAPNQYAFAYGQEISRTTYSVLLTALTLTQTANCTITSPIITGLADTNSISVGTAVESVCFAPGSSVLSKTSTTVTLNNSSIVTTSASATFFPWGNGDGSTTFNVPDYRGRALAGRDNMGGTAASRMTSSYFAIPGLGANGGSQSKTILTANLPAYTPTGTVAITDPGHFHFTINTDSSSTNVSSTNTLSQANTTASFAQKGTTTAATLSKSSTTTTGITAAFTGVAQGGVSTAFSIIQPTITVNYIIKITPDTSTSIATGVYSIGGMTGVIACGSGILCTGNTLSLANTLNVSNHSFAIGTGSSGAFTSAGPCALGVPIVGQGASADPTCTNNLTDLSIGGNLTLYSSGGFSVLSNAAQNGIAIGPSSEKNNYYYADSHFIRSRDNLSLFGTFNHQGLAIDLTTAGTDTANIANINVIRRTNHTTYPSAGFAFQAATLVQSQIENAEYTGYFQLQEQLALTTAVPLVPLGCSATRGAIAVGSLSTIWCFNPNIQDVTGRMASISGGGIYGVELDITATGKDDINTASARLGRGGIDTVFFQYAVPQAGEGPTELGFGYRITNGSSWNPIYPDTTILNGFLADSYHLGNGGTINKGFSARGAFADGDFYSDSIGQASIIRWGSDIKTNTAVVVNTLFDGHTSTEARVPYAMDSVTIRSNTNASYQGDRVFFVAFNGGLVEGGRIKGDSSTPSTVFLGTLTSLSQILTSSGGGSITLAPAATASAFTITFPAGTTNFSATGGTSQVVKQTSSGGAFTVARLACSDLSDASTGCSASSGITALTGDVTATGPGSAAATLATVNGNVGSFGSSTAIPTFTVNAKGLITAASTAVVIAPAGTLTGATLASNVLASSLTSVGTLTGGATGTGFTVALGTSTITGTLGFANGGTGNTTFGNTNIVYSTGSALTSSTGLTWTNSTTFLTITGSNGSAAGPALIMNTTTAAIGTFGREAVVTGGGTSDYFMLNAGTGHKFAIGGTTRMTITTGVQIGSPTGGDEGAGTLNISGAYYANGTIGVSCTAGTLNTVTAVVTNGIITHC